MCNKVKYLFIVNPNSGSGNHEKKIFKIIKYFKKFKIDTEIVYTKYQGHAERLAKKAVIKKYDTVIGCGGDGTINEVVNGLAGSEVKMGIIPWGTGNVFAREMNFPKRIKKICKIILKGKKLKIDLGRCNKKYFLLMASVGFDAYSLKQIKNTFIKKTIGIFAYILGAVKAFFNYSFPQLDISFGKRMTEKGTFILISNTSHYGRYFKITPFANPFDGMLDVIVYKKKGRLNFLKLLLGIFWNTIRGNHKNNHYFFLKGNSFYRTTHLKIKSSTGDLFYQLDGDHFLSRKLSLSIKEKALNVILPKKTVKRFYPHQ